MAERGGGPRDRDGGVAGACESVKESLRTRADCIESCEGCEESCAKARLTFIDLFAARERTLTTTSESCRSLISCCVPCFTSP